MVMVPKAQWAQRKDVIYLTIDLQDVRDPKIDISNDATSKHGKVSFKGEGKSHATGDEKHQYALDIELFGEVSPDESKYSVSGRKIVLVVAKAGNTDEHWPRLLQSKDKQNNITVDWDKWVDEDEEDEAAPNKDFDMSDLQNFSNLGGGSFGAGLGGGMSGIGNVEAVEDDEDDSDDEDMPPLESAK
ncbi:g1216 [Coccomyxa viridis]|uniref:G1216 protein n=1 Tax=Coccomyxa viridis TaxID=1274662 RepID=A0ABP1FPA8_9CHLO